jgi:hypothetical protein
MQHNQQPEQQSNAARTQHKDIEQGDSDAAAAGSGSSWSEPAMTGSARESRAAAGVGVSRWAHVLLWAGLAAGCIVLGGGRLLARAAR